MDACQTPNCTYLQHTDIHNNGGKFCCRSCGKNGTHGRQCQQRTQNVRPYLKVHSTVAEHAVVPRASNRSWFYANEIAQLYRFPAPSSSNPKITIGVLSFGGGLVGSVDSYGNYVGDVQKYWENIGINATDFPKIIVVPVDGAKNNPNVNDGGSTIENMIDLETIGGCYPSSNLTILFFLGTQRSTFTSMLTKALSSITIQSVTYQASILSISWGIPEIYAGTDLQTANALMQKAATAGITICVASGDYGSNDGVGGTSKNVDFPSCSPYCTAVGGTSLVSKSDTNVYSATTVEKAWSGSGGGFSSVFAKPAWQANIPGNFRSSPDIAAVADPNTGVSFYIANNNYIIGGTSVAAPIVAAFFASINLKQFANPSLYSLPASCFNDIKIGTNGAYACKAGYDNCTGFGSMNGSALSTALANVTNNSYMLGSIQIPLVVGQSYTIQPDPTPTTSIAFVWISSNPTVASLTTVNGKTTVKALAVGSSVISCSLQTNTVSLTVNVIARS